MTHWKELRLVVWVVAGAGVLAGNLLGVPVAVVGGLAALVVLLRTTPPDAIKLRRWQSDLVILLGSILVAPWRWSAWILLAITAVVLMWLRITRRSPWWSVLIGWNPVAFSLGWINTAAAAGAVVIPGLGLTFLSVSSGVSRWIVLIGLVLDALSFRSRRVRRHKC